MVGGNRIITHPVIASEAKQSLLYGFSPFCFVFLVFFLSFGGSIEGGQFTPSKDEIATAAKYRSAASR